MDSSDILLLCDEKLFSPAPSTDTMSLSNNSTTTLTLSNEDIDNSLRSYTNKQQIYAPQNGYRDQLNLSSNLSAARFRGVQWILQAYSRLRLECGTVFAAVNYLDHFISLNSHIKWEVWMIELLSIACLSIASKVDEVYIPSLHDYQTEDLEHTYQPSTIRKMEVAVLKALNWRLMCVTPYSYVDLLIHRLASPHASLASRTTELLLRSLLDPKLIGYNASVIAVAALRCSLEELIPLEFDTYLSIIENLIPTEQKVELKNCQMLMERQINNPHCCPTSPVTVIPIQRDEVLDSYVDIDARFLCNKGTKKDCELKKRKHKELGICLSK